MMMTRDNTACDREQLEHNNEQADAGAESAEPTITDVQHTISAERISFSKAGDAAHRGRSGRSGHSLFGFQ
jgi:hypothetical protein